MSMVLFRVSAGLLSAALLGFAVFVEVQYPELLGPVIVGIAGYLIQKMFPTPNHRWGLYLGVVLGGLMAHPLATLLGIGAPQARFFHLAMGTGAVLGCAALLGIAFTGRT